VVENIDTVDKSFNLDYGVKSISDENLAQYSDELKEISY
jgi:hypothetical protein